MKISFNQGCTLKCSNLALDLDLTEKEGFEYIELRIDKLKEYFLSHSLNDLKDFFAHSRIKPHAINGIYVYADFLGENDDPERSERLMRDILFGCRLGMAVGSRYMIIVPDMNDEQGNLPYQKEWRDSFANAVRTLGKLSERVKEYDMNLALELVGSPRCSVRTVEQALEIIKAVDKNNVGLTIDAFNLHLYNKLNNFDCLKLIDTGKIFVVHINNGDDLPLDQLRQSNRRFCDSGAIDLGNYLGALKATGYDGMVSIETFRPEYWSKSPEWVVKEAYRTTMAVLKKYNAVS